MHITIDTPYASIKEAARRTGMSESWIRKSIKQGKLLIRQKDESSAEAVLVNMIHLTMEAAEQAERVRAEQGSRSTGTR